MLCCMFSQNEHWNQSRKVALGEGRGFVNLVATDHNGFLLVIQLAQKNLEYTVVPGWWCKEGS